MIRYVSADLIITGNGEPLKHGIIAVDEQGEIIDVFPDESEIPISETIERYEGIIVPGFVNAHCHLELSHMAGKVAPGKGLVNFLSQVIDERGSDEAIILDAMRKADQQMQDKGIVAVGDISNTQLSKNIKEESSIYYHTFVEFLGFDPCKARIVYDKALALLRKFSPLPASLAPHAPYSVSKDLLKLFQKNMEGDTKLTTMHNQESDEENKFYRYKSGEFLKFYEKLKLNTDFFKPQARNSIQSLLPLFSSKQKILLVHNTYTSLKDVYFANRFSRDIHWCFCPKANLYIEGRLPRIEIFQLHEFNITLGTDSLASNDKLCILSELKAIKEHFPFMSLVKILPWATINGARFLGIDHKYGTIEKGKTPGLNLITNTDGLELTGESEVRRLV